MKYIKMKRGDEVADVADIEVELWQAVGFEVCDGLQAKKQAEAETEAQAPVKRRGRPRKAD